MVTVVCDCTIPPIVIPKKAEELSFAYMCIIPIAFGACAQHCDLVKSAEDPHTYLINDTADPLQQSLSGLLLEGLPPTASAAFAPKPGSPKDVFDNAFTVLQRKGINQNIIACRLCCQ